MESPCRAAWTRASCLPGSPPGGCPAPAGWRLSQKPAIVSCTDPPRGVSLPSGWDACCCLSGSPDRLGHQQLEVSLLADYVVLLCPAGWRSQPGACDCFLHGSPTWSLRAERLGRVLSVFWTRCVYMLWCLSLSLVLLVKFIRQDSSWRPYSLYVTQQNVQRYSTGSFDYLLPAPRWAPDTEKLL